MKWIIELESGCWLAPWDGDPGRTLVKASAKQFRSRDTAVKSLMAAMKHREFTNPSVEHFLPVKEAIANG